MLTIWPSMIQKKTYDMEPTPQVLRKAPAHNRVCIVWIWTIKDM